MPVPRRDHATGRGAIDDALTLDHRAARHALACTRRVGGADAVDDHALALDHPLTRLAAAVRPRRSAGSRYRGVTAERRAGSHDIAGVAAT